MISPEQLKSIQTYFRDNPTATLLINAHAGGKIRNRLVYDPQIKRIVTALEDPDGIAMRTVEIVYTKNLAHAEDVIFDTMRNKQHGLILVKGGDGTLANVVYKAKGQLETKVAGLGGGRQNVLMKALSGKTEPWDIFEKTVINGAAQPIDIGMIESGEQKYPFLANMDIGAGAEVVHNWQSAGRKIRLTMWDYFQREKEKAEYPQFRVKFDDNDTHDFGRNALFIAENFGPYGGHLTLTNSVINDGKLEYVFVDPSVLNNTAVADLFWREWVTKHPREKGIQRGTFSKAEIEVVNKELIIFQHDGEVKKTGNKLTLSTLPENERPLFFMPKK